MRLKEKIQFESTSSGQQEESRSDKKRKLRINKKW